MESLVEILKYSLPSLIMLIGFYLIFKSSADKDKEKYKYELFAGNQKKVTPIRLQAYERLILFLERIRFESVIMRVLQPKMTAKQLQRAILNDIKKEFSHNLSQQLYISSKAWTAITGAKEQQIRLVNLMTVKAGAGSATQLSQFLIEEYNNSETRPVETAIELLKEEARNNFGM